jgi:hypothetical protein
MKQKTQDRIETALMIAAVVACIWFAHVIVTGLQYRREMACRDNWDHGDRSAECAEILRNAKPEPTPKGAPPRL